MIGADPPFPAGGGAGPWRADEAGGLTRPVSKCGVVGAQPRSPASPHSISALAARKKRSCGLLMHFQDGNFHLSQITLPLKDNECSTYFGIKTKQKKKLVRAWEGSGRTMQKGFFPHEFWEVRKMMYALVVCFFLNQMHITFTLKSNINR